MLLGTGVGLGPGHIPPKGHSPQFSAHAFCGQTAGWIKMALGIDIVLDRDRAPPKRGTAAPSFWPMSIVVKRSPSPMSVTAEHLYKHEVILGGSLHFA